MDHNDDNVGNNANVNAIKINVLKNHNTLLKLLQKNFGDNDVFNIDSNIYREYLKSNSDDGFVAYMQNIKANQNINIDDIINCNGVNYNVVKDLPSNIRTQILQCESCQKYYKKDMIIHDVDLKGDYCYHCLFMFNYSLIVAADEKYGKKVTEYILQCKQFHDMKTCEKFMMGCCIICDHLNGKQIWGVEDDELLNGNIDIPDEDIYGEDSKYVLEVTI